jgi:hypothetical protein
MSTILAPHCDCPDCRVAHWDGIEPPAYTAHEVTDAWLAGHDAGTQATVRRLIATLTTWLTADELDPCTDEEPHADG